MALGQRCPSLSLPCAGSAAPLHAPVSCLASGTPPRHCLTSADSRAAEVAPLGGHGGALARKKHQQVLRRVAAHRCSTASSRAGLRWASTRRPAEEKGSAASSPAGAPTIWPSTKLVVWIGYGASQWRRPTGMQGRWRWGATGRDSRDAGMGSCGVGYPLSPTRSSLW
jgi:hypothetical protein